MKRYFRETASPYVITVDLFADKVLKACDSDSRIVVFSLSDYMPMQIRGIVRLKFSTVKSSIRKDKRVIFWREFLRQARSTDGSCAYKRDANTVGIWAHTSGTTGFPKTVLLTDKAYNVVAMQYMKSVKHRRGEVFLNIVVPFVVYGMLTCMHMPLCLGLTVVLIPKFEAAKWDKYFKNYTPNHIAGIPSYFSPLLSDHKLQNIDLSYLVTIAAGGDGLNEKLEEEINEFLAGHNSTAKLLKGYGMTEVCASAVTNFDVHTKIGSAGIPLVKNSVRIWDNVGKCECTYCEEGEICLSSPSLMQAYKDDQPATDALVIEDDSGVKWVHTGDFGYVDEDGFLFVKGRMKRFIFVEAGVVCKVLPKTIEDVIADMQEVHEVCAVSIHNGSAFVPKVYVALKADCKISENDMRNRINALCVKKLPDYMRPREIKFLTSLPKTTIGKIDYKILENKL